MELDRIVSGFSQQVAIFVCLSIIATVAQADLRVLFRFDESGHHVHSLTKAPSRQLLRKSASDGASILARSADMAHWPSVEERVDAARMNLHESTATLLWFDANGRWLSNTQVPDPRVTHSPAHIDGVTESFVSLSTGAWLANGPDEAALVTILFPAHAALALGAEEWHAEMSLN